MAWVAGLYKYVVLAAGVHNITCLVQMRARRHQHVYCLLCGFDPLVEQVRLSCCRWHQNGSLDMERMRKAGCFQFLSDDAVDMSETTQIGRSTQSPKFRLKRF